jgi:hypothetical protein
MMVSDSATLLLVAIRSGVQLSGQIRLAHVDATRRRELVLPLPRFETRTDWREAAEFFTTPGLGTGYASRDPYLQSLLDKARNSSLTREEQVELSHLHAEYAALKTTEELGQDWADGTRVDPEELAALFAVRQWQRRSLDPSPTVLQRLAGVLWEMGVDYASHQPDRFQLHGPLPRTLQAFFRGLDVSSDLPDPWLSELVPRLFQALAEHTSTPPGDIWGPRGPKTLHQLTSGILRVVARHVPPTGADGSNPVEDLATRDRIADWGEHLMRTVLRGITGDNSTEPSPFPLRFHSFDSKELPRVALDLLDAVASDPARLDHALGSVSLSPLLSAGIRLIGEHPSFSEEGSTGIPELLKHLADLLEAHPQRRFSQLLPELAERILRHAGEDPIRFWPIQTRAPSASPLVAITEQILTLAFQDTTEASSRPGFRPSDVVAIVDQVLNRCVDSPEVWLQPDGKPAEALQLGIRRWLALLTDRQPGRASPAQARRALEDVLDAVEGNPKPKTSPSRPAKTSRPKRTRRSPQTSKVAS